MYSTQHRQQNKHSPPLVLRAALFNLLLHNMCLHWCLSFGLQARGSFVSVSNCVPYSLFVQGLLAQILFGKIRNFLFSPNILHTDLPVKLYFQKRTCQNSVFSDIAFILYLFCLREILSTKTYCQQRTVYFEIHQATFGANWVAMNNGFATGHGEAVMIEVGVPHVAVECN